MNKVENKYSKFGLCADMMRTPEMIRNFSTLDIIPFIGTLQNRKKIFITGEGSSRIFPAKNVIYKSLKYHSDLDFKTEGACQASEYDLTDYAVFGVSNSGRTNELINLFSKLKKSKHQALFGITANENTALEMLSNQTNVLKCGAEKSVAATISVIEQALCFDLLLSQIQDIEIPSLQELSEKFEKSLNIEISDEILEQMVNANIIYFAGRNNGVAEELTLKTNEILRKRSDYLEGTYALHGIEEVMTKSDIMVIIDPVESEEPKFKKFLMDGAGIQIIAISSRQTIFPTITIPEIKYFNNYIEMAAGWNLLFECGLRLNIDIDKPERARKIGNEYKLTLQNEII